MCPQKVFPSGWGCTQKWAQPASFAAACSLMLSVQPVGEQWTEHRGGHFLLSLHRWSTSCPADPAPRGFQEGELPLSPLRGDHALRAVDRRGSASAGDSCRMYFQRDVWDCGNSVDTFWWVQSLFTYSKFSRCLTFSFSKLTQSEFLQFKISRSREKRAVF